jgi:hypothetical protein
MKFEKLGCREPLIKTEIFRQESDFAADFHVAGRRPENKRFAAAWAHEPEQHFYGRALAGTVGTQESKDFATRDAERQVPHSDLVAENLTQIARFDGKAIGLSQGVPLDRPSKKQALISPSPPSQRHGWNLQNP